jgi:hypothetical protein
MNNQLTLSIENLIAIPTAQIMRDQTSMDIRMKVCRGVEDRVSGMVETRIYDEVRNMIWTCIKRGRK